MAVDRAGTVWASISETWGRPPAGCVARLVGDRWEVVEPFGPGLECWAEVEVSPDGDVWITGKAQPPKSTWVWSPNSTWTWWPDAPRVAARFDGRTWTVYDEADGLPSVGGYPAVAFTPDGAAWVATTEGIARFDGTHWTMAVDGRYYGPIAAAPDGSVWAVGPAGLELVAETGVAP
jgi:hypothetical protein